MIDTMILERWSNHDEHGVFGEFYHEGNVITDSVERPWLNNRNNVSCIPAGTYDLVPFTRGNGDEVYALVNHDLDVYLTAEERPMGEGRYACLIHIANWMTDVEGCIGPGIGIAYAPDKATHHPRMMVRGSTVATKKLFDYIKRNHITKLAIVWKNNQ